VVYVDKNRHKVSPTNNPEWFGWIIEVGPNTMIFMLSS
jgi:hypothetical protein